MLGFMLSQLALRLLAAILGGYGIFCLVHEFRGARGRGSGVYTARYGDRYCLLCRSGTDPVTGGPP
jgi:hypothetical protein